MDIIVLLQQAVLNHASDIFVVAGLPVSYRANGRICREKEEKLMPPQTKEFFFCCSGTFEIPCQCVQTEGCALSRYPCDHI